MHFAPYRTLYDWRVSAGPVRRIHLQEEGGSCTMLNARVELEDGRRKSIGTGSSPSAHKLLHALCDALKGGTATFEGVESEAQAPKWKPRTQEDGRVALVYSKKAGFHPLVVEERPDFRGYIRPSQVLFVSDTKLARQIAVAIAEGDLDITPLR